MHRERDVSKLGIAVWLAHEKTALIVKAKGKYLQNMGFSQNGQQYLFCEEIVYLHDRDEVMLYKDDLLQNEFSRADVFELLNQCGIEFAAYQVFATLCEQRFKLFRRGSWETDRSEWKSLPFPQVVHIDDVRDVSREAKHPKLESELPVAFDVYLPQSGFSKTQKPKPDFAVMVFHACDPIPGISLLTKHCQEVSLKLCIVGDSSMTFLEVSEFCFEHHEDLSKSVLS